MLIVMQVKLDRVRTYCTYMYIQCIYTTHTHVAIYAFAPPCIFVKFLRGRIRFMLCGLMGCGMGLYIPQVHIYKCLARVAYYMQSIFAQLGNHTNFILYTYLFTCVCVSVCILYVVRRMMVDGMNEYVQFIDCMHILYITIECGGWWWQGWVCNVGYDQHLLTRKYMGH